MKIKLVLSLLIAILFVSCEDNKVPQTQTGEPVESMNKGEITIYSDIELKRVMDTVYKMYDETYPDVKVTVEYLNARKAMALLLSGDSRVNVVAREYLNDEDSVMKSYEVTRERMEIAKDALIFFTNADYPIDTLNVSQIYEILTQNKNLKDYFSFISEEPIFAVADQNSSVYAHLKDKAAKGDRITKNLKLFETTEQVKEFTKENKNVIGIGYLSHIVRDIDLKPIRLGFHYENGKREMPQSVHQSYIVMERYPFIVTYYVYLLEDRRNLPWWVATFFAKETKSQKYFNEFGIVPAYAQIKLIRND